MQISVRRAALYFVGVLVTACGNTPHDGTPPRTLNTENIKDAVPKREPITKAGNKSPYTVLGQTYVLLPTTKGYHATGIASWYGTKFDGQSTSNGETYDVYAMTAAHKTLPIPCYVLVTNLENNRQAIVRVNDRGPFVSNRIIDLSYAAAVKLGYANKGTAYVEVAAIDVDNWPPRGTPDAPPVVSPPLAPVAPLSKSVSPAPVSTMPVQSAATPVEAALPAPPVSASQNETAAAQGKFYVQAGAFSDRRAAEALRTRLIKVQSNTVTVQPTSSNPILYRVRVGPLSERAAAEQLRNQLIANHMSEAASIVDTTE
jgi:rare lipoprotein A